MRNIQFISHQNERYSYIDGIKMALEGGCKWIQLRMKEADDDTFIATAQTVLPLCRANNAICIFDDRVELAKVLKADGIHLGKNDMPIDKARSILGSNYIIGGTANSFEDVLMHHENGADYIGCGPFRYTTTKTNLSPTLGLEGYLKILAQMDASGIKLPVIAIGGITYEDVSDLYDIGLSGIAISSTILNADAPSQEMQRFIESL